MTAIAYHQVTSDGSLRLVPAPQVRHLRMRTDLPESQQYAAFTKAVPQRQMFRSDRDGPADRAVDVGAKAGTQVRAPVSGVIVQVRPYMLYGDYPDVEIDILPDANPAVRVIVFHVDRVAAKRRQRVVSGVTPLGRVRNLSRQFEPQLAEYTHESGNHVHIQVKRR